MSEYSVLSNNIPPSPDSGGGDNNCNKIQKVIDIQIVFTEFKSATQYLVRDKNFTASELDNLTVK